MYTALILISCYSLLRCCVHFRRDGLSEDGFKTDLRQVLKLNTSPSQTLTKLSNYYMCSTNTHERRKKKYTSFRVNWDKNSKKFLNMEFKSYN